MVQLDAPAVATNLPTAQGAQGADNPVEKVPGLQTMHAALPVVLV